MGYKIENTLSPCVLCAKPFSYLPLSISMTQLRFYSNSKPDARDIELEACSNSRPTRKY